MCQAPRRPEPLAAHPLRANGPRVRASALLLLCSLALPACHRPVVPPAHSDNLRPAGEHALAVPEPSGLSLSADGASLWMVSDEDGKVYRTDLEGRTVASFSTGHSDLEGITTVGPDEVAVLAERARKLLVFSVDGTLLRGMTLDIPGSDNSGPEALAWSAADREFYVLKERNPGLFLVLDEGMKERSRREMKIARDYSSLFHEPERGHLWIASDDSAAIYVVDRELRIQTVFSSAIPQMEGIAVDYAKRRIYAVSDEEARLYVYEFDEY